MGGVRQLPAERRVTPLQHQSQLQLAAPQGARAGLPAAAFAIPPLPLLIPACQIRGWHVLGC